MYIFLIIAAVILLVPLHLRGGTLHNYIVNRAAGALQRAGFGVFCEHPVRLADDRLDFVDLLVRCGSWEFCVEVETSPRRVLTNAAKADVAGLPLWLVVPNRKVRQAVARKLKKVPYHPGGLRIYILLLGELEQTLTNYIPLFSAADPTWENRKIEQKDARIP